MSVCWLKRMKRMENGHGKEAQEDEIEEGQTRETSCTGAQEKKREESREKSKGESKKKNKTVGEEARRRAVRTD